MGDRKPHPTHRICAYRGIFFCRSCGCMAQRQLSNLRDLVNPERLMGTESLRLWKTVGAPLMFIVGLMRPWKVRRHSKTRGAGSKR